MASAWGSRQAVGATAPAAMRPAPVSLLTATATEQVAMTMALRVPTFAKRLGHAARGRRTATISSSGRSEVCPARPAGHLSASCGRRSARPPRPRRRAPAAPGDCPGRARGREVASEGCPRADLRRAHCDDRSGESRDIGETRGDVGHRVRGADANPAVVPLDALQLRHGGEIEHPGELGPAEVTSTMRSVPPAIGVSSGRAREPQRPRSA